ncbi:B-cell receptor CD22-like [Amphiprion ocellaris]|uniref:B-cell receptor CD22-like n=1 Tax=Amphiprion ocellaris TaxID=80972 RepID=UPI0024113C3D|nr:B-cell receptor CD22-like [Amphiprion ocellaris]
MREAAMSSPAGRSGLIVFLLLMPVAQGLDVWRVTYTPDHICALDGSAVDISCTYTYPSTGNDRVEEIIWFTKVFSTDAVDLRRDSDYTGRVQYYCKPNSCTVRKTSLRKSNSAEYKFRIITNYGSFTGSPGVTLYVTGNVLNVPSVSVSLSAEIMEGSSVTLTCSSDANPAANYTWYKENEDSPKASGPTFTITDFTAEHNGNYHCEAQNTRGRYRFTLQSSLKEAGGSGEISLMGKCSTRRNLKEPSSSNI